MEVLEKKELNNALVAFLCTWGLQLMLGITVRNPLTLVFFALFCAIGVKVRKNRKRKLFLPIYAMSALLTAAVIFLYGKRSVARFDSALFRLLGIAIMLVGIFLSYFRVFQLVLKVGNPFPIPKEGPAKGDDEIAEKAGTGVNTLSDTAVFFLAAAICFLCWLPYFLYEYPGIMTADSIVQYEQVIGVNPLSNHHPIAHTMLIALFYKLGMSVTGDVNKAISFYTVAQMIFFAICCSRVVVQVKRVTGKAVPAFLSLAFFALVPFNAVFSVTIWKDIPFAGIVMLLGCRLCEMSFKENPGAMDFAGFAVLSVLMSVFRSNGWYAFLVCAPFFIYGFRKNMRQALVSVIAAVVIALLIKGPVMNAVGIVQPDFTESLSLPLQQVARVLVEDEELSSGDRELVEAVIDTTYIHELYAPDFADNIKELVRAGHPEVIENNKGAYLGLWMRLGLAHPVHYIRAWFDLEGGYVYPDVSYDVGNIDGIMGNSYGLVPTPLIGGKAVVKGKEILIKLGSFVPLYGMLWCAGAYTWLVVFVLFMMLWKKKTMGGKLSVFVMLQAALVLTLLIAAPVVDFRYEYCVVMLMPLTAAICAMIIKKRI
ncbi:DUF6020 family protein [Butyrivibrio sp. WCD2001]|uniref:DUF6020 family protein n=1 Tax=Butyrivibrio sp. WCD2001 TaxID=1280681 RepID=UPI00042866F4|nr:DUF6020 family protein [Butyrivibrio sp. WCD2001]